MNKTKKYQEDFTTKWWFFLILFGSQFLLFPIATNNFEFSEFGKIIGKTLSNSIIGDLKGYYLYFQIPTLIIFLLLIVYKNRIRKLFTLYVIISYLLFSLLQNIAITEHYGISVITINFVMFLFVAYSWTIELLNPINEYTFSNLNWKTSWLIVIAILCFWWPLNWKTLEFSPDISLLIKNGSSLAFCAMTPIFLIILTLNLPKVNYTTYRITSLVGVIIGAYNMMPFFNPRTVNIAVMHLPLLLISVYALVLSYKKINERSTTAPKRYT